MSCTSLKSQLWQLYQSALPLQLRAGKNSNLHCCNLFWYLSSQPHLGYNERVMSSPYLYSLSSPTANCPARIYSSPGDAESLAIPPAAAEKEGCDTGRTQPMLLCCVVAEGICLHFSWTLHMLAPKGDGRATKDNSNTHSL